jgi:hypothetical protein
MSCKVAAPIDTTLSCLVEQASEYSNGQRILNFGVYETLKYLERIEDVFLTVGESQGDLFTLEHKVVRGFEVFSITGSSVGRKLLRMLEANEYSDHIKADTAHEFSLEVRLWFKYLAHHGLEGIDRHQWNTPQQNVANALFQRLNGLVQSIRTEVQQEGFGNWQRRLTKLTKKNTASAHRWLQNIFQRYAHLLVIRLDLAYRKEFQPDMGDLHAVSIAEAFEHRERFLRNLPRWIQKNALLGYMVKTEYTLRRSIHHHLLVVIDASKYPSDIYWAKVLGENWEQEITQGRGEHFNVNAKRGSTGPDSGIGRVKVSDEAKVFNLMHRVLPYLVKPDFRVRWLLPKRHRLFLKSLARPLTGTKPGRPRQSLEFSNEQAT